MSEEQLIEMLVNDEEIMDDIVYRYFEMEELVEKERTPE